MQHADTDIYQAVRRTTAEYTARNLHDIVGSNLHTGRTGDSFTDFTSTTRTHTRFQSVYLTNYLLHVTLAPTRNQAITEMFLSRLREKHLVDGALFLVDSALWLQAAPHRHGLKYRYEKHGNRNSVERVFRELKRRTNQFSNCFSHAEANTVENWLQAFAFAWNQLI